MSRVVQITLVLNVELTAHFEQDKNACLGGGRSRWVLDEITSMAVQDGRSDSYDLATSSILARYIEDECSDELLNLYAQAREKPHA